MEIKVEDQLYQTGRLDPFTQFAVSRRVAPVIFALGGSLNNVMRAEAEGETTIMKLAGVMHPLSEALASMKDDDVNFVLKTCLAVVQRKSGAGWANVLAPNGAMMFPDIKMKQMMRLVVAVIKEEIGDFFPTPEAAE